MRLLYLTSRLNVWQNIFHNVVFIFFLIYLVTLSANAAPTFQPNQIEQNVTNNFMLSNDTLVTADDNDNINKMIGVENKDIEKILRKTTLHDDNFNDKLPRLNSTISTLDKKDDEKKQRFNEGRSEIITEKEVEFFTTTIETFINVDKININAVTLGDKVNSNDEKPLDQRTRAGVNSAKTIDENSVLSSTLSTDPYFISDLSDLLMENREFDRIDDIVDGDVIQHLSTPKGRFDDSIMDITSTTTPTNELYQPSNIGNVELIEKSRDLEINVGHEMMFTPDVQNNVTANVTVTINQYDKDEQMVKLNDSMGIATTSDIMMTTTTGTSATTATTTTDNDNGKAIKPFDDGKNVTKPKHSTNNSFGNTKKYMSGEKNQKKKTNLGRDGVKANKKQFSNNKSNLLPPEETEYATTTTLISSDIIIETSTLKSLSEFTNMLKVVSSDRVDDGLFNSTNTPLTETPTTQTTPTYTFMSTFPITSTSVVIPDNASNVEHVFHSIELASSPLPHDSSSAATEMNEQKIISRNDVANETDILVVEILERLNSTEETGNDSDKFDIVIEIETTENTFDNLHKNDDIVDESSETYSTTENLLIFEEILSNSSENIRLDNDNTNRKLIDKILESDSDEFFVPEDIKERENTVNVIVSETTTTDSNIEKEHTKQSTVDHDADTIFYISNTEVKVIESAPTPNSNQENQFFPAVYEEDVIINYYSKNFSGWGSLPDKYEEDIILSPLKNNFDPLKLNDENLSISYIGESFIDVKESTNNEPLSKSTINPFPITENEQNTIPSDVIIQPVQLPEAVQQQQILIGVPIIAELPPQIEIKQIEFNYNLFNMSNGERKKDIEGVTSRVIVHSGDNLQTNHLSAELPQDATNDKNLKNMPSKRNGSSTNATSDSSVVNVTAYSVLDDEPESSVYSFLGFNDVKTLLLACFATVAPLVLCVLLAFGIRYMWRKYHRGHATSNGITGDNSTDPLAVKSRTVSADELKSTESGYSINRSNDTLESSTEAASKIDGPNKANHNGANGSVITMTLKNNHLIVETEERNDMARDARETKMHYSPSEKDGVFVVEVARGADSTGACNGPINKENSVSQPGNSPMISSSPKISEISSRDDATLLNNEEIQVHQPPQGINDDEILNVDDDGVVSMLSHHLNGDDSMRPICGSTNTGLSQSDLSISDSCGSNQGYCYGSQQPYTVDTQGYQSSSPHLNNDIKPVISPTNSKPIIKSAIYKQESVEPASSYPEDGRPGRLRSDKNIAEFSKPLKEDVLIEEQRQLGNGEILVENRNENGLKTDGEECDEVNSVTGKVETFSHEPIENGDGHDSLILLLPAPPTVDEMKQLNDITLLENNNMDSLPPPPPPEVIVEGPTNGAS